MFIINLSHYHMKLFILTNLLFLDFTNVLVYLNLDDTNDPTGLMRL